MQTAVKILPSLLKAPLPWWVKVESLFHLTCTVVYIPAVILSLVLFPVWNINPDLFRSPGMVFALALASFFGLLTCSAGSFYMLSQKAVGRSTLGTMAMVPLLMAVGTGVSVINCVAVLEGLFGRRDTEFVRTPKYGNAAGSKAWKTRAPSFKVKTGMLPTIEITLGLYMFLCAALAVWTGTASGTVPFLLIFSFGYLYVGVQTLHSRWLTSRAQRAEALPETKSEAEVLAA